MRANQKVEKKPTLRSMKSVLYPDLKLGDIAREMIEDVIKREVLVHPYITLITKGQMGWGSTHWRDSAPHLQCGLRKHYGLKAPPSQQELEAQMKRFGYTIEDPEPRTWSLPGEVMKRDFINVKGAGKGFDGIEFLYGRGYIVENGEVDKNYTTRAITGWFIFSTDPAVRQEQALWLKTQKEIVRARWTKYVVDYIPTVKAQIESGHQKMVINSFLLSQNVYKEIDAMMKTMQIEGGKP